MLDEATNHVIEQAVRNLFADSKIVSVRVDDAHEHDDEMIFYVTVVFDAAKPLDSAKTRSVVRHTRQSLNERHMSAGFPVFRFISKADDARMRPATA
jgi:hypothetical protein